MKIIYVGGAADGDEIEVDDDAHAAQVSFKLSDDLPGDQVHTHQYTKRRYTVRDQSGDTKQIDLMVLTGMPDMAVKFIVKDRMQLQIEQWHY